MPTIPKGMKPIVSGYSFGAPGGAMRTEVAGGMARYALDFSRGVQRFNVTLVLRPTEFAIWSLFFHRTIALGTISFDMPLNSGLGLMPHSVNIVPETYSVADLNGGTVSVAFVVEAESAVYALSQEDADATLLYYSLYGDDAFNILPALGIFANSDTNELNVS